MVEHVAACPIVRDRSNSSQRVDDDDHASNESEEGTAIPIILEGVLEEEVASISESNPLPLKKWLGAFSDALPIKTVYQLSDIAALCRDVQHQRPPFIHIHCRGGIDQEQRPYIVLLKDRLYLDDQETIDTFWNLRGVPIFFSASNFGLSGEGIQRFRQAAELGPIASPIGSIMDSEARLFGLMLYQAILVIGMDFPLAVHNCYQASRVVGLTGLPGYGYFRLYG